MGGIAGDDSGDEEDPVTGHHSWPLGQAHLQSRAAQVQVSQGIGGV